MAVSFDHPLGQTSDCTEGKCSSLLSCPEKWEMVSVYTPRNEKLATLDDEVSSIYARAKLTIRANELEFER